MRKLGLQTALSSKLSSGLLRVVPNFNEAGWAGTRDVVHALGDGIVEGEAADGADNKVFMERFGPKTNMSILFLYSPLRTNEDELFNFSRIIRNIPNVELLSTDEVVAYDILKYRWVVLETSAVDALSMDDMVFDFDAADAAFTEQLDAQINAAEAEHPLEPAQPQVKSVNLDASA